ncbi:procyclic form surface glycoprotein [Trypanosoma theileri]|uniref:Procyclic form surface glycoprotein n=1 Tax=Trypanosoma theileri TaxID=67003 RepID=A0A1X0P0Z4_9TRYP|nr:procyclic form surface glycoprotein [Trypanosoma theileri]ORC90508.1 procyclic form surface glycoprotein [Trypanosoma theileri]
MCCFGKRNAVGDFLKTFVPCVCLILFGGVALIIVGSFLVRPDTSKSAYKAAVNDIDPTPIQAWSGTINGEPAYYFYDVLQVPFGDYVYSYFIEADVPLEVDPPSMLSFTVNINTVQNFTRTVSRRITEERTIECSMSSCSSSSGSCSCYTAALDFQANCSASGGNFTPTSPSCGENSFCGTCAQYKYLSGLYLVASEISPGVYKEDSTLRSAIYDFGELANIYQVSEPSSVVVRLYSDKDPFIALQRLNHGVAPFGAPRRTAGIVMIVFGSVILLLEIGACVALICYCVRRNNKPTNNSFDVPTTSNQGITDSPGYTGPTGYGQPPQQPQGYGYGPAPVQGYLPGRTESAEASNDFPEKK